MIPQKLLEASKANLISIPVVSIRQLSSGRMEVVTAENSKKIYDAVIVAAPQTTDSKHRIDFENFTEDIKFEGKYHKTVCTLINGILATEYFSGKSNWINEILTTTEGLLFNSIGQITPVGSLSLARNEPQVWKVFSQQALKKEEVSSLFSQVNEVYVREWLAYPSYDSSLRNDSFILAPNLYYLNAIEWVASAMEMSIIGAKNVALLTYKNFKLKEGVDRSIISKEEL